MCGIFCCIRRTDSNAFVADNESSSQLNGPYIDSLMRRGPDCCCHLNFEPLTDGWSAEFTGCVLWTQGDNIMKQPITNQHGDILLWNGDLYNSKQGHECDSAQVLKHLEGEGGAEIFGSLCGPFAFVFWNCQRRQLWFGRDVIGRHSLLWHLTPVGVLLTSVGHKQCSQLSEVPSSGIFMADLSQPELCLKVFPWSHLLPTSYEILFSEIEDRTSVSVSVQKEISHMHLGSGKQRPDWLDRDPPDKELELFLEFTKDTEASEVLAALSRNRDWCARADCIKELLIESVRLRVNTQPPACQECLQPYNHGDLSQGCHHTKLAVLFSGGLDSTLLALLAHKTFKSDEAIDLYNVAFEHVSGKQDGFRVPDRLTGEQSLLELQQLAPNRFWRFVKIDVTQSELYHYRETCISHLIHPLGTVLDDSLGCALWFAASGKGIHDGEPYTSPARVVLIGMGADELFGGYMRQRVMLKHQGWLAFGAQLRADIRTIGRRNLGRDNRVAAHHGRAPRIPFLHEPLVAYVDALPIWQRCFPTPSLPPGVGDKLLLRLTAWQLGLRSAATFPKRALQFGSRIASSKERGSDASLRL